MKPRWALHSNAAHAFVEDEVGYVSLCGEYRTDKLVASFLAATCKRCDERVRRAQPSEQRSEA